MLCDLPSFGTLARLVRVFIVWEAPSGHATVLALHDINVNYGAMSTGGGTYLFSFSRMFISWLWRWCLSWSSSLFLRYSCRTSRCALPSRHLPLYIAAKYFYQFACLFWYFAKKLSYYSHVICSLFLQGGHSISDTILMASPYSGFYLMRTLLHFLQWLSNAVCNRWAAYFLKYSV